MTALTVVVVASDLAKVPVLDIGFKSNDILSATEILRHGIDGSEHGSIA